MRLEAGEIREIGAREAATAHPAASHPLALTVPGAARPAAGGSRFADASVARPEPLR